MEPSSLAPAYSIASPCVAPLVEELRHSGANAASNSLAREERVACAAERTCADQKQRRRRADIGARRRAPADLWPHRACGIRAGLALDHQRRRGPLCGQGFFPAHGGGIRGGHDAITDSKLPRTAPN